MTCIAGLVYENEVWIGGDSAGVGGWDLRIRKDTKVFKVNGRFLIGYTSSFRMGQLLRFGFSPPEQKAKIPDYEYMCTAFIDAVRKRFKDGGYLEIKDNKESGGCFLVGYKGRLYAIYESLQVAECVDNYDAVGCGEKYALGSLFMTQNLDNPEQRILQALKTAEYFSAGVRGPFIIEKLIHKK